MKIFLSEVSWLNILVWVMSLSLSKVRSWIVIICILAEVENEFLQESCTFSVNKEIPKYIYIYKIIYHHSRY